LLTCDWGYAPDAGIEEAVLVSHPDARTGLEHLRKEHPDALSVRADEREPNVQQALERLLDLNLDELRQRTPIWPKDTAIDIGFFDVGDRPELMAVDGEPLKAAWPGWYFTRWEALAALRAWLANVHRGWSLPAGFVRSTGDGRNRFVLLQASDQPKCHAAGQRLAQVLQECYDGGETAPGITVRSVDRDLAVAPVAAGLDGRGNVDPGCGRWIP